MSGDLAASYYDLPGLLALRATFAGLDPAGEARAVVLVGAAPPAPRSQGEQDGGVAGATGDSESNASPGTDKASRSPMAPHEQTSGPPRQRPAGGAAPVSTPWTVAILAGSFDPLTNAHLALARAAREVGGCDAVYLALSRRTVDKEARVRPTATDRALLLRLVAAREPGLGVLLFNRGLYAEQAVAARAAFPAADLRFVVGFDKARQIFDPRYYADRDAALRQLFSRVALLVAPRADDGQDALAALLDRPENAPFRGRVDALPFDPAWSDDSATAVRAAARVGAPFAALVPPETVAFIAALAPYAAPDPADTPDYYERREAIIARFAAAGTAAGTAAGGEAVDLRALLSR